jgi:hypothetical protein
MQTHRRTFDQSPQNADCGHISAHRLPKMTSAADIRQTSTAIDIKHNRDAGDVLYRENLRTVMATDSARITLSSPFLYFVLDSKDRFARYGAAVCDCDGAIVRFPFELDAAIRGIVRITIPSAQLMIPAQNYYAPNIPLTIYLSEIGGSNAINSFQTCDAANIFHFIYHVADYNSTSRVVTIAPTLHDELILGEICPDLPRNEITAIFRWLTDPVIIPAEFIRVTCEYTSPAAFTTVNGFAHQLVDGVDMISFMNFDCSNNNYDSRNADSLVYSGRYHRVTVVDATHFTIALDLSSLSADPNRPSNINFGAESRTYELLLTYIGANRFRSAHKHFLNKGDNVEFIRKVGSGLTLAQFNGLCANISRTPPFTVTAVPNSYEFDLNIINYEGLSGDTSLSQIIVTPSADSVITRNPHIIIHAANRRIILPIRLTMCE